MSERPGPNGEQPYASPVWEDRHVESQIPRGFGCSLITILTAWALIGFGLGCLVNLVSLLFLPQQGFFQELPRFAVLALAIAPPLIGCLLGATFGLWQLKRLRHRLVQFQRSRQTLEELVAQKKKRD